MERIPLTCLTWLNSPTTVFSASLLCSSFMGADLPFVTSATWATKPLSTWAFNSHPCHWKNNNYNLQAFACFGSREQYPEEMICVIASKPHKFKNVINSFGRNSGVETKFNIPVIRLHSKHETKVISHEQQQQKHYPKKILKQDWMESFYCLSNSSLNFTPQTKLI